MNAEVTKLKVIFYEKGKIIEKDNGFKWSKLEDDSSMYIDITTIQGSNFLKLLMESDEIELQGIVYIVNERRFMTDGTALYLDMKRK